MFTTNLPQALLVFIFILSSLNCSEGASCSRTTALACDQTNYVASSCVWNVCQCSRGIPIRSGCGEKLPTPEVTTPPGTRTQVVQGTTVQLTCTYKDKTKTKTKSYQNVVWYRNGQQIRGETKKVYSFVANSHSDLGDFSCQLEADEVSSNVSKTLTLEMFNSPLDTAYPPQMIDFPVAATEGAQFFPTCRNVPIGALVTFSDPLPITAEQSARSRKYKCAYSLPNIPGQVQSGACTAPPVFTDIPAVEITRPSDQVYVEVGHTVEIMCDVTLASDSEIFYSSCAGIADKPNFAFDSNLVKWQWQDHTGNNLTGENKASLNITITKAMKDSYINFPPSFWCTASYNEQPAKNIKFEMRNFVTIIDMPNPSLEVSALKPLKSSRLVLTANMGLSDAQQYSFQWHHDGTPIWGQSDYELQLDNMQDRDTGVYQVTATIGQLAKSSQTVVIPPLLSTPSKPVIQQDSPYYNGDDDYHSFKCATQSATVGMTYIWVVNGETLPPSNYSIFHKNGGLSKDSDVVCSLHFAGSSSETSDAIRVIAENQGPVCNRPNDCRFHSGTTGVCTSRRCECKKAYKKEGDKCSQSSKRDMSPVTPSYSGAQGKICRYNSDCSGPHDTGVCKTGSCECEVNYLQAHNGCLSVSSLGPGHICQEDDECYGPGFTGKCTNAICDCQAGFIKTDKTCSVGNDLVPYFLTVFLSTLYFMLQ